MTSLCWRSLIYHTTTLKVQFPLVDALVTLSMVVLDGNKMLCASVSMLALPVCDGTQTKNHVPLRTIVMIITPLIADLLFLCLVVTIWKKKGAAYIFKGQ